ncbi:4-(cytidine 5'-diphospho)-2-C-methyl-D-erythritol kinase [Roseospira marina]|uniref:4-diphosphocytidyl-2-C-methyl-D-erythritol kinase n=1 Tax=Roseospira marina TaxID=140057 RepID=A0A5M6IBZ5_9PROT|nr:4-(cytidine 5'-diphospho)-2-C-methyl-D-erythritol kinase [Roseospira marina]KAA5605265.1 4-(cytidine 5'-diphospho)-2-C-methyl-D-erythritol kinase [Roseospira marina]MBB4314726.1 4-diphosphocytidyl-2-C-methyl-D-erythritol kinase [Roseospira marina]MBB5087715.1 4-diphosphocytidyl-2-C-methyl-D-erythritol kinase [Roseospira marina]
MNQNTSVRLAAPAKINLYLHIIGRRPDGYHRLDSLMAFAAVFDTVVVTPADTLSLTVEGPRADALDGLDPEDNLMLRAARALADVAGIETGAHLTLIKRLPTAGGIGGGSADAAAVLRGLYRLWNLDLDDGAMLDLALTLGADVPICLYGRAANVSGIGEVLTPAPALPPVPMLLVNPGVPVPTKEVFGLRNGPYSGPAPLHDAPVNALALANDLAGRRNDLETAARTVADEVSEALERLTDQAGALLTRMSGSGGTCFALFGGEDEAETARQIIAEARPDWWIERTRLITDARALDAEA